MFKLGEYREDDVRSIADRLREAGFKVELKPSLDASAETDEFLQGRFSELKVDIKDEDLVGRYGQYIDVLKKVLKSKPSPEDFTRKYILELFPSLEEKKARLSEMAESIEHEEDDAKSEQNNENRANELKGIASDLAKIFAEGEKAKSFVSSVLYLNEIDPGEDIDGRMDDPVVAIPVDLDDYGIDHPRAKRVLSVYLDKCYDLYVDELSTLHSDRLDGEFIKQYTDEHLKISSLNYLLTDLIKNHSSEKMDIQTFEDECSFIADSGNRALRIVGHDAAEEIAKALEKNGMIKMKGDTIRWKK